MVLSITHRATGVALSVGTLLLLYWLLALAEGHRLTPPRMRCLRRRSENCFDWLHLFVLLPPVQRHSSPFLGCRHGLRVGRRVRSGKAVVALSIIMTVLTWAAALGMGS